MKTRQDFGLPAGNGERAVEIWYMKKGLFCIAGEIRSETGPVAFDPTHLEKTHVLLGTVHEDSPDDIFISMQGESWSPNGEARTFIAEQDLSHTSMCRGDALRSRGKVLFCDFLGWKPL